MSEIDWSKMSMTTMWRDWIVKSEQQWSENMSRLLKDEKTGPVLSKQIDEARMMHKMFGEMAQMSLSAANLPSRTDFEALDERMGRIEDGMSAVQAGLAQLRVALVSARAVGPAIGGAGTAGAKGAAPARTRKPAGKASAAQSTAKTRA